MDKIRLVNELLELGCATEEQILSILSGYKIEKIEENSMCGNLDILEQFVSAKTIEGLSKNTIYQYRQANKKLLERANRPIRLINTNDIREYMICYQSKNSVKSKRTIQNTLRYIGAFFSWLELEDIIQKSPVKKIKSIRIDKTIKKPFTEQDVIKLRDGCKNTRDLAMIEFLNSSGCRVSELIRVDIEDLDFSTGKCLVLGKGNRERYVYLNDMAIYRIKEYIENRTTGALFLNNRKVRISRGCVESFIRECGRSCGVNNSHPHRFRRTLACRLIDRGMPIQEVQKVLGHEKIETTMIYLSCLNEKQIELNQRRFA